MSSPRTATRESPPAATKTQQSQKQINKILKRYAFRCKLRVLCLGFRHKALQASLNISFKNNYNEWYCVEKSHLKNHMLLCWPHGADWWCVANGTGRGWMVSEFVLLGRAMHILVWLTFTDSFLARTVWGNSNSYVRQRIPICFVTIRLDEDCHSRLKII